MDAMEIQRFESVPEDCGGRLGRVATPPMRNTDPVSKFRVVVSPLNVQANSPAQFVTNRDRKSSTQSLFEVGLA